MSIILDEETENNLKRFKETYEGLKYTINYLKLTELFGFINSLYAIMGMIQSLILRGGPEDIDKIKRLLNSSLLMLDQVELQVQYLEDWIEWDRKQEQKELKSESEIKDWKDINVR